MSLALRRFTLVTRRRLDITRNFGIVANRAKTNGSLLLSTLSLYTNRHTSDTVIERNTTGTSVCTRFSIRGGGIITR